MSEQEWIDAGLLDSSAPDADDRRELLRYLEDLGVPIQDMVDAAGRRSLETAAPDHLLRIRGRYTMSDAATTTGLSVDLVRRIVLAAGFALPAEDEPTLDDADLAVLEAFGAAARSLGEEPVLGLLRVIGTSLARIADAADAMFLASIEGPMRASSGAPVSLARSSHDGVRMLLEVPSLMAMMFRRHVGVAIERSRAARRDHTGHEHFLLAVGFADLVGSTMLGQRLPKTEFHVALEAFEREAAERALLAGGRLVKTMGDAVMVVGTDAVAITDALGSLARFAHDHPVLPEVRAAVAYGPLLGRDGDYHGIDVNIAARAVKEAAPGTLVVTDAVAMMLAAAGRATDALGERTLRGIDTPVLLHRLS